MQIFVDGGEAVVEAFRSLGVDYVMASPGSEWGGVWEALARQKVNNTPGPVYLSCAHETLAVDLAIGYTVVTGKMQAVMLHTGVGLLQGSMGIDGANRSAIPMVVVSGEALTYGEKEGFNPGAQWQANLSVVGGPHRLAEPIVKWASQATSTDTVFQQLVSAGELAQREPPGPTYLSVSIETQLNEWHPPVDFRTAPPAPKPVPSAADIEKLTGLLINSQNPVIVTEASGADAEGFNALVELADLFAIPIVEGNQSTSANFPMDHPMHQGFGQPSFLDDADLILTLRCRAPWYPPSNRLKKATIVAIDETPFRLHMVHHAAQADMFLAGDVVAALRLLADALRAAGIDQGAVDARHTRWSAVHSKLMDSNRATEAEAADQKAIHPCSLMATLGETLPDDTFFVDETITHRGLLLRHLKRTRPQTYFRPQGGLGQGIGVSLGVKLAAKDRPVVLVVGDGSFMYNPVIQSLALSQHQNLPIMIVVSNNTGYQAMKNEHQAFYPDGVSASNDLFYGEPITDLDYAELPKLFGGFGRRVENLADLPAALKDGLAATENGQTAIINVMVDR
jgi:acetolactate synthase-1/2/3 large subunit